MLSSCIDRFCEPLGIGEGISVTSLWWGSDKHLDGWKARGSRTAHHRPPPNSRCRLCAPCCPLRAARRCAARATPHVIFLQTRLTQLLRTPRFSRSPPLHRCASCALRAFAYVLRLLALTLPRTCAARAGTRCHTDRTHLHTTRLHPTPHTHAPHTPACCALPAPHLPHCLTACATLARTHAPHHTALHGTRHYRATALSHSSLHLLFALHRTARATAPLRALLFHTPARRLLRRTTTYAPWRYDSLAGCTRTGLGMSLMDVHTCHDGHRCTHPRTLRAAPLYHTLRTARAATHAVRTPSFPASARCLALPPRLRAAPSLHIASASALPHLRCRLMITLRALLISRLLHSRTHHTLLHTARTTALCTHRTRLVADRKA